LSSNDRRIVILPRTNRVKAGKLTGDTMSEFHVPFLLDTDTYKATHHAQYREDLEEMTAYFTFRGPLDRDDHRIVIFGLRYAFERILSHRVTQADIDEADTYLNQHGVMKSRIDWPKDLWQDVVDSGGALPFKVAALPDGSVVYPGIPVFTITATSKYARLATWLETSLMRIWSPCTTATKSRHVWKLIRSAFDRSVDEANDFLLPSRFHDFGSRGVSSSETAMVTGAAHLLSFEGTDTMTAGWLATKWNNGKGVGESVIASEHSVMTTHEDELHAVRHLIKMTPCGQILSCVSDSYDYENFCWNILPQIADEAREKGIFFVLRPDSGDPVEAVVTGLRALDRAFGSDENSKGYRVIRGAGVIQGDGLDVRAVGVILEAVIRNGFSAQCVAFGMGGGLLQSQTRDTMKAAVKVCQIRVGGKNIPIMKAPKTDGSKNSLPGNMQVNIVDKAPMIYSRTSNPGWEDRRIENDMLQVIWNSGPTGWVPETFEQMRTRLNREWSIRPLKTEILSNQMKALIEKTMDEIRSRI
jgi:nicotinic acid phosphoribosyltransferase